MAARRACSARTPRGWRGDAASHGNGRHPATFEPAVALGLRSRLTGRFRRDDGAGLHPSGSLWLSCARILIPICALSCPKCSPLGRLASRRDARPVWPPNQRCDGGVRRTRTRAGWRRRSSWRYALLHMMRWWLCVEGAKLITLIEPIEPIKPIEPIEPIEPE
jgi:hypothetical protein